MTGLEPLETVLVTVEMTYSGIAEPKVLMFQLEPNTLQLEEVLSIDPVWDGDKVKEWVDVPGKVTLILKGRVKN